MSETPPEPQGTTYQKPPPRGVPQAAVGTLNAGRVAAVIGSIGALLAALVPVIADLDITSTVGIVGGAVALAGVVAKWLDGWQKYEADVRDPTKFNEPAP